jgi:hypothetical protein
MARCWKWYRRDPGGFPIMDSSGSPLFCNGGLATTCCPKKYYFNCDPETDPHDGFEDDPCEVPDYYTGKWAIYTVCDVYADYGCQIVPRPKVTLNAETGGCDGVDDAVLCEWSLGRVSWTVRNSDETAHGTMCVSFGGHSFCSDISYSKGETATFYVDIPESYGDQAFGDSSHVFSYVTRIALSDGRFWDMNGYVWCEDYAGNRHPGSITPLPESIGAAFVNDRLVSSAGIGGGRSYRLRLHALKTGYDTWEEAVSIYEDHYDALKAYAESCKCSLYGRNSCWIVCDMPGGYDESLGLYRLERFAHEGGCSGVITGEDWWELSGIYAVSPVQIIIKNLETGAHWNWDGGDMMLPPCHELGFYIADLDDFIEGGGCSGDAERISPPEDCTQAIRCAFCAVPGTSHGIDCQFEDCE